MLDEHHWNRALWRSRRGMLELDLVLVEFARRRYPQLPPAEQCAYRELLGLDDWLIWDWLQREDAPPAALATVVDRIVAFAEEHSGQRGQSGNEAP